MQKKSTTGTKTNTKTKPAGKKTSSTPRKTSSKPATQGGAKTPTKTPTKAANRLATKSSAKTTNNTPRKVSSTKSVTNTKTRKSGLRKEEIEKQLEVTKQTSETGLFAKYKAIPLGIRRIIRTVLFALILIIVLQLFYPANLPTPLQKIGDQDISNTDISELKSQISTQLDNVIVVLHNENDASDVHTDDVMLGQSGDGDENNPQNYSDLTVNYDKSVDNITDYPLIQRLIPGTILRGLWQTQNYLKPEITANYIGSRQLQNASISTANNELKVQRGISLLNVDSEKLSEQITNLGISLNPDAKYSADVYFDATGPEISTEYALNLAEQISQNTKDPVVLNYEDSITNISQSDIISLLDFVENKPKRNIDVIVNSERLKNLLEIEVDGLKENAVVNNIIVTMDGQTQSVTPGKAGNEPNFTQITADLMKIVLGDEPPEGRMIKIENVVTEPIDEIDARFGSDWSGLISELNHRYSNNPNIAIYIQDLSGRGHNYSLNANSTFVSASTYKLFAAYSMFKSPNVPDCFENMIIHSDNSCPESFLGTYGVGNYNRDAKSIGATNTYMDNEASHTNATDLGLYLAKLHAGLLLTPPQQERLLNAMKTQVYRQGIPAGVGNNGYVADKVGFLNGLLHDAALVYSHKGTYIEVILTDGMSWGTIADIAKLVEEKY